MSNDKIILDQILHAKKAQQASKMKDSDYFELFCADEILKDFDLSFEEIAEGIVDGSDDGGFDSIYTFVNGDLITDDTDLSKFKKDVSVELFFIQSKITGGFAESAIEKFIYSSSQLLNLSKTAKKLKTEFNEDVIERVTLFRNAYKQLAAKFPKVTIRYVYACKGDTPNAKVLAKVDELIACVKKLITDAEVKFNAFGARNLLDLARRSPDSTYKITVSENPISSSNDGGFIALVGLLDYKKFISDQNGRLRKNLFEANVRDYQGDVIVNEQIYGTLKNKGKEDFWWLNNGITIVSSRATQAGKEITIENPCVVNGLQTSHEIFKYFDDNKGSSDSRNVLVRIVVPTAEESRDRIIRSTNSQTAIPQTSLRATDSIHRDIEDFLRSKGTYYDRRKNFYKNEGHSIDQIIGIGQLAQAVMAILLQKPSEARARPSSLINDDKVYKQVFSKKYDINVYYVCTKLVKLVDDYLKSCKDIQENRHRNNIKYHMAMLLASRLTKKAAPKDYDLASIDLGKASDQLLKEVMTTVYGIYQSLGSTDKVAKGSAFAKAVAEKLVNSAKLSKTH